jgi:ubiquitin-conjugating enzyme E2 D
MSLLRCLTKQLKELENDTDGSSMCAARPVDLSTDMFNWIGWIKGPDGSLFEGGTFHLTIHFPTNYPFKPPRIRFTTRIYHPNISSQGDICLDILQDKWSPALSIRAVLLSICSLLTNPNPEHGLDQDILHVYRTDRRAYEANAQRWTRQFAMNNAEQSNDRSTITSTGTDTLTPGDV